MNGGAVEACGTFETIDRPRARRLIMANPPQRSTQAARRRAGLWRKLLMMEAILFDPRK
jgi:hypothetical protein